MITYYYTYHFFTDHDPKQGVGDKWMGECENSNQDGDVALNRASISDKFIPLQITTSELFTTLTEVFVYPNLILSGWILTPQHLHLYTPCVYKC